MTQEHTLGTLAQGFVELLQSNKDGVVDLTEAAEALDVRKRRLYDITSVLEGVGVIVKHKQNKVKLRFPSNARSNQRSSDTGRNNQTHAAEDAHGIQRKEELQQELAALKNLNEQASSQLSDIVGGFSNNPDAWLTYKDLRSVPGLEDQTLIAIQAPSGAVLKVPKTLPPTDGHFRYEMHIDSQYGPITPYIVNSTNEGSHALEVETASNGRTEQNHAELIQGDHEFDHREWGYGRSGTESHMSDQASSASERGGSLEEYDGLMRTPGLRPIDPNALNSDETMKHVPHFAMQMDHMLVHSEGHPTDGTTESSGLYSSEVPSSHRCKWTNDTTIPEIYTNHRRPVTMTDLYNDDTYADLDASVDAHRAESSGLFSFSET